MPLPDHRPRVRFNQRRLACLVTVLALLGACASQGGSAPPATPKSADSTTPDPAAALAAADKAYTREDWARAESDYLTAARGLPADPEPWFKLGNVYFKTGRHDVAARAYEQALRRAPGHAKAWHNLGVVRLHQADDSFERVLTGADPHDGALDDRAQQMRDILDDAIEPTAVGPGSAP
jgi:Flp pilus assembly protein TadD